jgi:hypothetical protein
MCAETLEESIERINVVRSEFLKPALTYQHEKYQMMVQSAVTGMWCFFPRDSCNSILFMIKRMIGVENYYFREHEYPKNYDKSKSAYNQLSFYDKFLVNQIVFTHETILKFTFGRLFFNAFAAFLEILGNYFPIFAMLTFGYDKVLKFKDVEKQFFK